MANGAQPARPTPPLPRPFSQSEVASRLVDRLDDCARTFPRALLLGGAAGAVLQRLAGRRAGVASATVVDASAAQLALLERRSRVRRRVVGGWWGERDFGRRGRVGGEEEGGRRGPRRHAPSPALTIHVQAAAELGGPAWPALDLVHADEEEADLGRGQYDGAKWRWDKGVGAGGRAAGARAAPRHPAQHHPHSRP